MTIISPKVLINAPLEKTPINFDNLTTSTVYPEIWNRTWGYTSQDWGLCLTLDIEGNIIVGGASPNSGQRHVFLVKYDLSGIQLWNKTWSKNPHDEIYDIVVDKENNIYTAGRTGPYGSTGKGMLLIKFNSTGDEIWNRDWGGSNDQGARAIALDSNEDVYVTGRASSNDAFLRKYNSSGDLQWSKEWGGGGSGYENWPGVYGMTIDNEENIYITGRTINLGPGGMDMFLLKYNITGDLQWAETWGYLGNERGYDVELDSNNDLFVTCFSSTTNILHLVKYDSSGSQLWNRTISTLSIDGSFELEINSEDMLFITGTKPDNNQDIFLLVLDYDGGIYKNINWSLSGRDSGLDMILNQDSEIFITGITNSIGAGNWDMILIKYASINKFKVDPINIDGTATGVGANNWTWASNQLWCSGSGTYGDPFIIKDLIIDGDGTETCIDILNSDVYFIIQNCTSINSGGGSAPFYNAGIRFYNVSNAKLIKNNCTNNQWGGIRLYYECNNNTILDNIVDNSYNGIYLRDGCNNNSVSNNTCIDNSQEGIELYDNCDNNNLTSNTLHSNDRTGIRVNLGCDYNFLYNNTLTENTQEGIRFISDCFGNTIYYNNVSNNLGTGVQLDSNNNDTIIYYNYFVSNAIQAHDSGTNNQWDNGIIGNFWSDYGGDDADDDGIGDIPYDNITGTSLSQDNYPVWDDGDDLFPNITILVPTPNQLFGSKAPDFFIDISDSNLHKMWYTIDNGLNNFTFTSNETIDQTSWTSRPDGTVTIQFYANDTLGHTSLAEINVRKDAEGPEISILEPSMNDVFEIAPAYEISITDLHLDTIWYTIDSGEYNFTVSELTGIINQDIWDSLLNGYITIRFYANDTLGNINSDEVIVVKDTPTPSIPPGIPGYDLFIVFSVISLVAVVIIQFKYHRKIK